MSSTSKDEDIVRTVVQARSRSLDIPVNDAVVVGQLVYTAGCVGYNFETNKLAPGGIKPETKQAMNNLGVVLRAAGSDFSKVVKMKVLVADMADFATVNEIYKQYFKERSDLPARTCFQVAALPMGARIEVEAVAVRGKVIRGIQSNL